MFLLVSKLYIDPDFGVPVLGRARSMFPLLALRVEDYPQLKSFVLDLEEPANRRHTDAGALTYPTCRSNLVTRLPVIRQQRLCRMLESSRLLGRNKTPSKGLNTQRKLLWVLR